MTERPAAHVFLYVDSDIPEGMTIGEWRAARAAAAVGARRAAPQSPTGSP